MIADHVWPTEAHFFGTSARAIRSRLLANGWPRSSARTLDLHHARMLAQAITSQPELEVVAPLTLSAICFRHRRNDNEAILQHMMARGRMYLSNATINGQFALRPCFVNHRTTAKVVHSIVDEVIAAADEIIC
jgi:glutamate/tyrosine decarboxylase-like PLP-dependent enzyme